MSHGQSIDLYTCNYKYKYKMVQQIVYTDNKEDKIVEKLSDTWKLSKADTIKKIIREFKEESK